MEKFSRGKKDKITVLCLIDFLQRGSCTQKLPEKPSPSAVQINPNLPLSPPRLFDSIMKALSHHLIPSLGLFTERSRTFSDASSARFYQQSKQKFNSELLSVIDKMLFNVLMLPRTILLKQSSDG
jgi:hypothetical protein